MDRPSEYSTDQDVFRERATQPARRERQHVVDFAVADLHTAVRWDMSGTYRGHIDLEFKNSNVGLKIAR